MSYPKANLGAIVLPIPDDEYSWEDYKEEYGIDLDEVFVIIEGAIHLRYTGKPLYISDVLHTFNFIPQVTPVIMGDPGVDNTSLILPHGFQLSAGAISGFDGIIVTANRTINYYDGF